MSRTMRVSVASMRKGIGLVVLLGICFCASFAICAIAIGEERFNETADYFIGQDGQSYGVPVEGDDGLITMPDMVRVRASNGEIGYVSPDAMIDAFFEGATSQDEIDDVLSSLAEKKAYALMEAADRMLGEGALVYEEAFRIGDALVEDGGIEKVQEMMRTASGDAIVGVAEEMALQSADVDANASENISEIEDSLIMSIINEARRDVSVEVPVYASDGTTVIGSYEVNRM